jgi:galactokinase
MVEVLREEGLALEAGFDLRVGSTLPVGAGLSSSAALELASGAAVSAAYGGEHTRGELARLAQRAENEFVGVPCGLLDQAVVALGGADRLVRLDARTEEAASVPFPPETGLWIFRTHQAHALSEGGYRERHDEAWAARDRLREVLGGGEGPPGRAEAPVEHLVDVTPSELEAVKGELSETLYRRARHVTTEHRRVQRVVKHLEAGEREAAGELLFASHESSRVDYENSTEALDFVVERLAEQEGVLGARLTGAGFGGAAMAWTRAGYGEGEANEVAGAYAERFGAELETMACQPAPGLCVWS